MFAPHNTTPHPTTPHTAPQRAVEGGGEGTGEGEVRRRRWVCVCVGGWVRGGETTGTKGEGQEGIGGGEKGGDGII